MNPALAAGEAGMAAQQAVLDAIAANLANVDTPGFRAQRPEFAALVAPDGRALAAEATAQRRLFLQGKLDHTGDPRDLAIDGDGFFRVVGPDGRAAYTRAGNFSPDAGGRLTLPGGHVLDGVRLPRGTTGYDVSDDGVVHARVAGRAGTCAAGRIRLHSFASADALAEAADGFFYPAAGAGREFAGPASGSGFGKIRQGCLERGNVSVVGSLMAMLAAQRAYEANAKSVQAADEMLRLANNLERG